MTIVYHEWVVILLHRYILTPYLSTKNLCNLYIIYIYIHIWYLLYIYKEVEEVRVAIVKKKRNKDDDALFSPFLEAKKMEGDKYVCVSAQFGYDLIV